MVIGLVIIAVWSGVAGIIVLAICRAAQRGDGHGARVEEPRMTARSPVGRGAVIRAEGSDVRHERLLGLILRTLSLRDPTATRHAAAVAFYARELARAAGLSERDQAVAHSAGLLHDIGREAFPDSILVTERELEPEERRFVRRHPIDGARLLRDVPGLQAVADTVLAHHERPDGRGYPHGICGDAISLTARVVAIAEVYDALTAPDSYRRQLAVAEALSELRRVAGTQLDADLVELFISLVRDRGAPGFRAHGDADLESELRLVRTTPLEPQTF